MVRSLQIWLAKSLGRVARSKRSDNNALVRLENFALEANGLERHLPTVLRPSRLHQIRALDESTS